MTTGARCDGPQQPGPRIPPLSPKEWDEAVRGLPASPPHGGPSLFKGHDRRPPLHILATMARHPRLFEPTLAVARCLTGGLLPARDRELVVLRAAWRCGCAYQWTHHHLIGLEVGLSEEEIQRVAREEPDAAWEPHEAALLSAVDELHSGARVSDATWRVLEARYDEARLIELLSLVGEYHKVSFLLNTLRTPLDEWAGPSRWPGDPSAG